MKQLSRTSPAVLAMPTETDAAAHRTGMRALMLAVLEDAIQQLSSSVGNRRAAAERWIMSSERHYVFSFAVICETLALEPSAVRRSLIRLLADKQPGRRLLPRTRHNVRHTSAL
jgi:hypothetical protein